MTAPLILLITAVALLGLDALMRDIEGRALTRAVSALSAGDTRGAESWRERFVAALKIRMCARGGAFGLCFALVVLRMAGLT
jgi:hypothetical protein